MKPLSYLLLMLLFLIAGFLAGVWIARGPGMAAGLLAALLSIAVLGVIAVGRWWMDACREGEFSIEQRKSKVATKAASIAAEALDRMQIEKSKLETGE